MNGQNREDVFPGRLVDIILKKPKNWKAYEGIYQRRSDKLRL